MTAPILTLAEVQALAGFTEGPWRGDRNDGTIKYTARGSDDRIVLTVDHKNGRYGFCVDESYPSDSVSGEHDADERLFLAAPALHATCEHLFAEVARLTDALRQIATAIGTPAHVDSLADLPGLVMMVQAVVQRAESSAIVVADAVAAERMAIGAWIHDIAGSYAGLARGVEHGDHIDDDAPPLPSLRMTLLLRDELHRQIKALEAERDRRIDPVEHAKAAMDGWSGWWVVNNGMPNNAQTVHRAWLESPERVTLLDRVGPDVLAEVER